MSPKKSRRSKRPTEARASQRVPIETTTPEQAREANLFPIVGIGASAGGFEAFRELLSHLPLDTGMAFVLVQHLDPQHESALVDLLGRASRLPVGEAANNLRVEPNHVYVIPPNTSMRIGAGALILGPRAQAGTPARSIDTFFEALAEDQGECAIGVVLSGTATDGTLGLEAIKAEGGITFAQDDSARYDSMPRSAVAAGCVDFVLSPKNIAAELTRIARHPAVAADARAPQREDPSTPLRAGPSTSLRAGPSTSLRAGGRAFAIAPEDGAPGFKKILLLLRNHAGVDFSLYKSSTIQRRIRRRMVLSKQNTLGEYAQSLRGNGRELDALYSDVLISVTSFFRNPDAYDVLERRVWPELLKQPGDEPIRIWVLGCSSGQEAYSLAMGFTEAADRAPRMRTLQIFATDLNEGLLDKARHGLYTKGVAEDVSPERLRRFFVEEEGGYRVSKALREKVVFARQNVISDPPFSRVDLISCRNLLIYFESGLQKRVLPVFHYALKPKGFLYLGASESIGNFTELFEPIDKKQKIYVKKPAPTPSFHLPVRNEAVPKPAAVQSPQRTARGGAVDVVHAELTAQREADRVTVNEFAPPAVLVNDELQVLQFRGPTGAYLEPPKGKASFDVLKMARSGLMLPLRAAINKARKAKKAARAENVRIDQAGRLRTINVAVVPLRNLRELCFLIVFEDLKRDDGAASPAPGRRRSRASAAPAVPPVRGGDVRRVTDLEADLAETRDYLQSIQEQHEAANEELQASNEEVQSANEELQSINEELETSKEELESANEELTTVNEEMTNRNAELHRLNSDLVNIQTSAHQVIFLLARDLTIRRFSAKAEKYFNLLATDVGRPFSAVRHSLDVANLDALIRNVIDSMRADEREVRDKDGRWFSLRVRPYMTIDNKVDGAVLVLVDIDALKRSEQTLAVARAYADNIIETVRDPLLVLDDRLLVERANRSFYRTFGVTPAQSVGRHVYELGNRQWDIPALRTLLQEVLTRNTAIDDFSVTHDFDELGRRTMLLNARRLHNDGDDKAERILLAIEDVTERVRAQESLTEADRHKDEFLAMLAHELRNPLAPMRNSIEIMRHSADREKAPVPDDGDSPLAMLDRQVDHMVRLVDDLLDASRISRGSIALRRQPVELASVVGHAVEAVRPSCDRLEHRLAVTLPPAPIFLDADAARLTQIVGNLLSNACKFTGRGGRIWLTAEREAPSTIVIRVRDNGIGINPGDLARVFDLFTQVDTSLERIQSGLGIGLSLVRTLARMHGGDVDVASPGAGQGTEFIVRLPIVVDVAERPRPIEPERLEPMPALRILVVDDNQDSAESMMELLQYRGHELHVAHNGLEAVEAAARLQPDVIVLDLGMPGLNGYDAARKIRDLPLDRRPILIALTGWSQEEYRLRSAEAGFDAHIVKPVKDGLLLQTISRARQR